MEGSVLPFQHSHPQPLYWLQRHNFSVQMQNGHHSDACLCWYTGPLYMKQKTCYLMENSAYFRHSSAAIPHCHVHHQTFVLGLCQEERECKVLFYQPARAILVFPFLWCSPRCCVDWSAVLRLLIKKNVNNTTVRLLWFNPEFFS